MSMWYPWCEQINLEVKQRISAEDAQRQMRTAHEILRRLNDQPGVILADEVGMGKTFVSLAVAASVALAPRQTRPVVVMVPPSLREKWPNDFALFRERCLDASIHDRLDSVSVQRPAAFLRALGRRRTIIFLPHGALSRSLRDPWMKVALIQRAMKRRRDQRLRKAVARWLPHLVRGLPGPRRGAEGLWDELLRKQPDRWPDVLWNWGVDPRKGGGDEHGDDADPTEVELVPAEVMEALERIDLRPLYDEIAANMPRRPSPTIDARLQRARQAVTATLKDVWKQCMTATRYRAPLLILDEAHHLKNPKTRLASLFQTKEAGEDAEQLVGPLADIFDRMLFLTATPFQLGHHELCEVLRRFRAINWQQSRNRPADDKQAYEERVKELRKRLDHAQICAVRFDKRWGKLTFEDVDPGADEERDVAAWWRRVCCDENADGHVAQVVKAFHETHRAMREAEVLLRPWVIRHRKPRRLPHCDVPIPRRRTLTGRAIMEDGQPHDSNVPLYRGIHPGISIDDDESLMPFLLAARATACTRESRPIFAEGLASSYEAFRHTRQQTSQPEPESPTDGDDESSNGEGAVEAPVSTDDQRLRWYLDQLDLMVPLERRGASARHPKVRATVQRAIELWRRGEKVLVFCHFVQTGRALRSAISDELHTVLVSEAARVLGREPEQADAELTRIGERFEDREAPIRLAFEECVGRIVAGFPALAEHRDAWTAILRRNMRTPWFLARFFPLRDHSDANAAIDRALEAQDGSGLTLRELIEHFFRFLQERCGEHDREEYREALERIHPGSYFTREQPLTDDEVQGDPPDRILPNVRLVNGDTARETRRRLMLAFNTPFAPEILIASSVMAEGVDLQLACRYVIHHDLCWNPSTLEQRTGRIDRIGAKAEHCRQPIHIFLPYIAETQDEKMYRVVSDRDRWFNIVMGEKFTVDAQSTDRLAERIPLPQAVAEALRFRLGLDERVEATSPMPAAEATAEHAPMQTAPAAPSPADTVPAGDTAPTGPQPDAPVQQPPVE